MASRKPLMDEDGEVRELTEGEFAKFVSFSALPAELQVLLSGEKHVRSESEDSSTRQPAA